MKTALFTNFSDESFTGYWDGKPKTFKAGQSMYMPDYLASHFAKHLVNRELLRTKPDGTAIYKDGEKMTSPKRPNDNPLYMELFNKAYTPDDEESIASQEDPIDVAINSANKNRDRASEGKQSADEPQIILPPADDEDEDGDEESFGGAPTEAPSNAQENSAPGVGL